MFVLNVVRCLCLFLLLVGFCRCRREAPVPSTMPAFLRYGCGDMALVEPMSVANVGAEVAQELDSSFARFLRQWEIVGASVALAKDGKIIYAKGLGYADRERGIKARAHHLFRIASVSKLFTATGIMRLVEQGKLRLSDKVFGVGGILAAYNAHIADPHALDITVEHLLTHTAGWRNVFRSDPMFITARIAQHLEQPSPLTLDTIIKFMLSQQGYFTAGSLYDYSNFGYCLLGKIIEAKTGMPYEVYMRQQVLMPIRITRMSIGGNRYTDRLPAEVRYYDHRNAKKNLSIYNPRDSASRVYEGTDTRTLGAAGGWLATAGDLVRFVHHIDGRADVPDILRPETIALMTNPHSERDSTERRLLGWKQVDAEKWWRTGSLASTGIAIARRHDGWTYAFVTNTGAWRGPLFSYEIDGLMRRTIAYLERKLGYYEDLGQYMTD